jgi:hypothetical protein
MTRLLLAATLTALVAAATSPATRADEPEKLLLGLRMDQVNATFKCTKEANAEVVLVSLQAMGPMEEQLQAAIKLLPSWPQDKVRQRLAAIYVDPPKDGPGRPIRVFTDCVAAAGVHLDPELAGNCYERTAMTATAIFWAKYNGVTWDEFIAKAPNRHLTPEQRAQVEAMFREIWDRRPDTQHESEKRDLVKLLMCALPEEAERVRAAPAEPAAAGG